MGFSLQANPQSDRVQPPNRRLALFLGAGASAKAGVPTTFKFVGEFRSSLVARVSSRSSAQKVDPKLLEIFDKFTRVLRRWKRRNSPGNDRIDVELLLEALTLAENLKENVSSALHYGYPVAVVGKKDELHRLLDLLQRYIREKCYVGPYSTDYLTPLLRFIREAGNLHVFTVNYDLVMEGFLERNNKRFTDGFDLNWSPGNFSDSRFGIYLYKLHGSVTWYRAPNGASVKIPIRVVNPRFMFATGGIAQPLMLYPAQKWVSSGVFLRLLSLLHETLADCEFVFVVGYSFRDDHFVRAFQEAALANPNLRLILVGPGAEGDYQKKLRYVLDSPISGAKSRSELEGRVFRVPFLYENVINALYSTIWTNVFEAVLSDRTALNQAEVGADVKWHEVAMKYLEAGYVERPAELEEPGIDWTKVGDVYPIDFYGRKAIILSSLNRTKEADEAWGRARKVLAQWICEKFSFEVLGDWGVRVQLNSSSSGSKSTDQVANELGGLARFCRRYKEYIGNESGLTKDLIDKVLSIFDYLKKLPTVGLTFEAYAKSRSEVAPEPTKRLVDAVATLKKEGKPATSAGESLADLFRATEGEFQRKVIPFLATVEETEPAEEKAG